MLSFSVHVKRVNKANPADPDEVLSFAGSP